MESCSEMEQITLKSRNTKKPKPKLTELAEACAEKHASEMQQIEVAVSVPVETAELLSSAEDDAEKTKVRKTSKARRKSSTPRKVVLPNDKEAQPASPPKQRKSQRIRTPARPAEIVPLKKSAKHRAVHSTNNSSIDRKARGSINAAKTGKRKRVAVKKIAMGQGKTAKRKGVLRSELNHASQSEKDKELATVKAEEMVPPEEKTDENGSSLDESQSSDEDKDSVNNEKDSSLPTKKKIVHKKRPCEVCGRCYNTFYLKVHMRKHTGEKPFACKECSRSFSTDSLLRTHVQRYHGNTDELHCDVCKKVFASKGSLKIHRQIHSDEKPYKCHLCDKEFKQPGVLNEHLKTHNNDFPFICEVCGKRFKSKRSVFRHKESTHDGIKNMYLCTSCGKIFNDKSSLWRHQKRHEQGYTKHICEVCGKQFHERKVLSTHMLIHENKKPYQCEVCSKQFRHYSVLKRHMCCHTGVKPFKCDSCSRQFIHRVYMLRHKCSQKNIGKTSAEPPPQQPLPLACHNDGEAVLIEQIHTSSDQLATDPKDAVVFVPELLNMDTTSLLPLHSAPGQELTHVPLPQVSQSITAEVHTFHRVERHGTQAETVIFYNVDGVDGWGS